ncbi:hypothetical protein ScPMuIL_007477 [Solemya velum]
MPTLGYWKIRGLAQPIRLLLHYVEENFNDKMYEQGDAPDYSRECWMKEKNNLGLSFPNLPYYIDGPIKITQSNAILRYIARKHNLLGKTTESQVRVDMMLDQAMEFRNGIVRLVYNPNYESLKVDYFLQLPSKLEVFENFLGSNKFFGGDEVTVCDFPMYELLDQSRIMDPTCLEKFEKISAFMDRFESLPQIKEYTSSPNFMKRPINNKIAAFK